MATITTRKRADGSSAFKAEIVIKSGGSIAHRESKTFDKKSLARDWAKRREIEIQESGVYKKAPALSIGSVIALYLDRFPPDGRSKRFDIGKLMTRDIAKLDAHTLTAKDLIKHVIERNQECKPQTANNDLVWLNTVLKTMAGVIHLETDLSIFDSAREVLRREGMIAKSHQRERRPTRQELWSLSRHFYGSPMLYLMWFAIYSARRQSEIVRIDWGDIDHAKRTCVVRDLKDPRKKGISKRCKIPRSAYRIMIKHGSRNGNVFQFNGKTISAYFTNACKLLGIKDLHFHDLRHEATSRLFERGLSIQQVQQITLHSTWATLQRYVNLDPGDIDI